MEQDEYRKNASDMIYLVNCALHQEIPDTAKVEKMNLAQLFEVCESHILTACTAYALQSAGIDDRNFKQAKEKAIRKNILFDMERKKILSQLEKEQIWYMPLKGALLKDWYPKIGMRQMSDNDILYDGNFRKRVREIMLALEFTCEHYGEGNNDSYLKKPVLNFEMHHELFTSSHVGKLYEYYRNVKERLVKDEGNSYGYHFTAEDFYIYITTHEYKHYSSGGTGVRSLVDTYIFMQKFGDSLNWDYIHQEFEKLELTEYEQQSRELAMKVFSCEELTEAETKMLDYYILSGTYGTIENSIEHNFQRYANNSKAKYVLHRIFPSMHEIERYWSFFYRHKWLIPVLWIYRPFHGLISNRQKIKSELKYLKDKK